MNKKEYKMNKKEKMSIVGKLGYGAGHIFNDMSATMWFSYSVLFFHNVLNLSNTGAGLIVMVGQVVDGIASILVGALSDKDYEIWIYIHYGKRKVYIFYHIEKDSLFTF